MDGKAQRLRSRAPPNNVIQRKSFWSLLLDDDARKLSQGNRKSSTSSMSQRSYSYAANNDDDDDEVSERAQLSKLREITKRIAYEKARRKSFCKLSQLKKMRIRLRGTREKTFSAKKAKSKAHGDDIGDTSETLSGLSISDAGGDKIGNLMQDGKNFTDHCVFDEYKEITWRDSISTERKKVSVQWDSSLVEKRCYTKNDELLERSKGDNGKRGSLAESTQNLLRAPIQHGRRRSGTFPLSQDQAPDVIHVPPIDRTRKAQFDRNDRTKANAKYQNDGKLPRLSRADIKVLEDIDALLIRNGTIKSKFGSRVGTNVRKPSLLRNNTSTALPPMNQNLSQLAERKMSFKGNMQGSTDDEKNTRRKSLNQKRRVSQLQEKRASIVATQQQKNQTNERMYNPIGFPLIENSTFFKRRLSEAFRELESCRYLRMYKKG